MYILVLFVNSKFETLQLTSNKNFIGSGRKERIAYEFNELSFGIVAVLKVQFFSLLVLLYNIISS